MTREQLEELWEKMSREDWLAGEGFSGKVGGLTKIPHVCKPRIFEFAIEIRNATVDEAIDIVTDYQDINPLILERLNALKIK